MFVVKMVLVNGFLLLIGRVGDFGFGGDGLVIDCVMGDCCVDLFVVKDLEIWCLMGVVLVGVGSLQVVMSWVSDCCICCWVVILLVDCVNLVRVNLWGGLVVGGFVVSQLQQFFDFVEVEFMGLCVFDG